MGMFLGLIPDRPGRNGLFLLLGLTGWPGKNKPRRTGPCAIGAHIRAIFRRVKRVVAVDIMIIE
jgi:hypothetical protein